MSPVLGLSQLDLTYMEIMELWVICMVVLVSDDCVWESGRRRDMRYKLNSFGGEYEGNVTFCDYCDNYEISFR